MNDQIKRQIERLKNSVANVLIQNGSTEERNQLASEIHNKSTRSEKPFVYFDPSQLSNDIEVESELFGHEKGAFNGAFCRKIGLLEVANSGTIFIDNVNTLSPGIQAKLHYFVTNNMFNRMGDSKDRNLNVRIIVGCDSDSNLDEVVSQGNFREDLFYRINTLVFTLDREVIAESTKSFNLKFVPDVSLYELEKLYICKAIEHFKGNKTKTANSLGITIKTLYNKLYEYGIWESDDVSDDPIDNLINYGTKYK